MINAFLPIASVQTIGFAADMRLALRGGSFNHGNPSSPSNLLNWYLLAQGLLDRLLLDRLLDRLFQLPLFLLRLRLRLRLAPFFFGIKAGLLEQPEIQSFRPCGRARCQLFTASTAC